MILSYVQITHSGKILPVSLKVSRVKDALEQCNIVTFPMPTGRYTHMTQMLQCTQGHVGIYQTEYFRWNRHVQTLQLTCAEMVMEMWKIVQSSSAGTPVLTGVPIVQPAPTHLTFNVQYQDNAFILNSIVMVILNVNMGKMRILMCARRNTNQTILYQNMPPSDV